VNPIAALARKTVLEMKPYSSARSLVNEGEVFLDANEWAWSPHGRYPEPQPQKLCKALATLYYVDLKNLLVSRGSDEAIDCLVRAFCEPHQDAIIYCPPTFAIYEHVARLQAIETVPVALNRHDWSVDVEGIKKSLSVNTKIVFLCSPNNPTGRILPLTELEQILKMTNEKCLVVVDEAYIEFSEAASATSLLASYDHLVVLRTLSKYWSAAGLRLGATLAHGEVIAQMRKVLAPYPIPAPVATLVLDHLRTLTPPPLAVLQKERKSVIDFLQERTVVRKVWPSDANFVLVEVHDPKQFVDALRGRGVIVRDRSSEIPFAVRVTIGLEEENVRFKAAVLAAESEGEFGVLA
jgi:histidinol-phosphate aminotransferase